MKHSEHACKIFFNYSKLCVISFFAKKVQFLMNSRNIIGRSPSTAIPLLANQDLTPMLSGSPGANLAYGCVEALFSRDSNSNVSIFEDLIHAMDSPLLNP